MEIGKKISLLLLILLYLAGGINHFWHPDGYIKIIPHYLPFPAILNYISGACEILFAVLLMFNSTRSIAAWLIILMLAAFLPVHIDMLLHAPMQLGKLTVTPAIAWIRLLLQPVLMLWARWHTQRQTAHI
ncbi:DoxX family protein [Mucilaginibacter koreensis]